MIRALPYIILLVLPWLECLTGAREASAELPAVHHDLRIKLDPSTSSLKAVDYVRVASGGKPLHFLLAGQAEITDIRIEGLPAARYNFRNGRLTVFLPMTDSGEKTVRIAYRAVFDDHVPENPAHDEDPSYGITATITAKGAFLSPGAHWYPLVPAAPATFRVRVETPPEFAAVTSGRLAELRRTDGGSFSVWESTHPLEAITLAAGPYRIEEKKVPGASVYTFLYPDNAHLANTYLEATAEYLGLYQGLFGPYPFAKFAVAENFFPTGYGFPSWTLLGSTVVRLPFIVETSLGHEVAHSWWGNGIHVDYSRGNWSEGLTTYVADHLFKERADAESAREYRLKILRDYTALVSPDEAYPLKHFTSRKSAVDQAIGYGKSAMVFHMARQRIGNEHFWEGLRALARSHLFREASWSDFGAVWQKASGIDLGAFLRQWVERPGAPVLQLADVAAVKSENGWQIRGRLVQNPPYYNLNVPLRLETSDAPAEVRVSLSRGSADFRMQSPGEPRRLVVDPQVDLFRRLHPEEMPPTVNGLRGSDKILAIVSGSLPKEVAETALGLLGALRHPQAQVVHEEDLAAEDLAGRDILYLGMPLNASLRPPLPENLGISSDGFSVAGISYGEPGAALFAALPHPHDSGRQTAVFLPLSGEAAQKAIRKIPHYGKYSYLVFASGNNREKGIWPILSSPLIHNFQPMEAQP